MSWATVRGHDAVVRQFDHTWKRGRLAHAYLFVGPKGIGKHTFARELAKALLCEAERDSLEACDACPACHQITAGAHPDLFFASRPEDSLDLPIEVVRELCGHLELKPARGFRKVAILDEADDMNEASSNCFLKTLEEPPSGCVLILVGTSPERQLSTIVSRCQPVRFAPLAPDVMREVLQVQGVEDVSQMERSIRLAGGSVGQALALGDADLWTFRQTMLDHLSDPKMEPQQLSSAWMRFVEDAGKESAAQRGRASVVLRMLVEMLESALKLSVGAELPNLDANERAQLTEIAERLGPDRLLMWLDRAFEADMHIDRRVQLVLAIEAFVDALARRPSVRKPA